MTQREENPYERYFEQINEEFNLVNRRLKQLIRDRTALGLENESILREFLKNYIPKHYSVGHGFIFKNYDEISSQCDIIIYDSSFFPPLFKQGDFVIVQPESVMTVIEVKTEIKTGRLFLDSAIDNIKSVRKLNSRISGLIFAYRGSYPVTILNGLTAYYEKHERNLGEIFELMVNLERGYSISLKSLDGKTLFNLDTTMDNFDGEFVFHPLKTINNSFYLFYYYILRQLRTYVYSTFIATGKKSMFETDFNFIPVTPSSGLNHPGYFDDCKDKIKKLNGKSKFDENGNFLGI